MLGIIVILKNLKTVPNQTRFPEDWHSHRRRVGKRWNDDCLQPWWGCISASGVGNIVLINGIMNAEKYREILMHDAIPSGKGLIGNGLEVFQCHSDSKHTANVNEIIFGGKKLLIKH